MSSLSTLSRQQLEDELRRVSSELDTMTRLNRLGTLFVHSGNLESVLTEIVETAIAISSADFGNIQLLDPDAKTLRIVAQHGFPQEWLDFWQAVPHGQGACGTALALGERIIIEDIEKSPVFASKPALEMQRHAGVRAVQSTPLVSRTGKVLGMFSTHYKTPHRPGDAALKLLDLLARQASDIIDRARVEEKVRESERRERERAAELAVLLNAAPTPVFIAHDPECRSITGNGAADELLRNPQGAEASLSAPESLRPRHFTAVKDGRELRMDELPAQRAAHGEEVRDFEFDLVFDDGAVRHVVGYAAPLRDEQGRPRGAVHVLVDITARQTAEQALAQAKAAAERANRAKDQFLAMLGHELRNPLAPIRNSVALLRHAGPKDAVLERAREIIDRQVSHLTRLVDELLDVSRIESGKVTLFLEEIDLAAALTRALDDYRDTLEKAGIELECRVPDSPAWVRGDGARLSQAIGNLLHNAAKFTDKGGTVTVQLKAAAGRALISVRDNGIGMDTETAKCIFEPFVQADRSLDRSRGGLGLGLAVVKGLVGLHGGTARASSAGLGQGAEFVIELPLIEKKTASAAGVQSAPAAARSRVLIIEDHRDAAESLQAWLEMCGHTVDVAHTGPDGVKLARAHKPAFVLCDIGLPGMDGYEVAGTIRSDAELRSLQLIAMTGYGQDEDRTRAKQAGFDLHLTKPVDPDVLARMVAG